MKKKMKLLLYLTTTIGSIFIPIKLISAEESRQFLLSLKGGQEIASKYLSPRIRLSEVELVLIRDSQKVGTINFPNLSSAEKTLNLLKSSNPKVEFNGEIRKLDKPSLDFINNNGAIENQIQIGDAEEVNQNGKHHYVNRYAVSSDDMQKIAFAETSGPEFDPTAPISENAKEEHSETSNFKIYAFDGKLLWKKDLPQFRIIGKFSFSNDGERFITIQQWTKNALLRTLPEAQLVVYDNKGLEIFIFPNDQTYRLQMGFTNSPSGRYIGIIGVKETSKFVVLIFDVVNHEWVEYPGENYVRKIYDNGTFIDRQRKKINFSESLKPLNEK